MASAIDEIINKTMNSACKRSYILIVFLYILTETIHVPQVLLIMFIAPPSTAFDYNPYARNAQSIITEWDLTEARSWIPGMLQAIFFAGFMVGTIIFGQLSDRYGRKSVSWKLFIGLIVISAVSAFTQNWQQLTACRVIAGFIIGGLGVINNVWLQEMSAANLWVINGAVGSLSFTINLLMFILIGYRFPDWRTFCIIMAVSGLPGFLFYCVVPESPRWLYSQQRYKEAECSIAKVKRLNGTKTEYETLQEDEEKVDSPKPNKKSVKNSILDLIKYPVLRYRVLILSVQWFTTSFVYYAITLGAASFSPNFYLALTMSTISQLPSVPIYLYFMQKKWCGRRKTLAGLMFLGGVGLFIMYIVPNTEENAWIRLSMSMVSKISSSGCFTLIYVFTPELFPTVVRNVGLGSMSTIARFGSMAAPFMATYTVNSGSDIPFLGYGLLSGIAGVLALSLPETRGKRIINEIEEAHSQEDSDVD